MYVPYQYVVINVTLLTSLQFVVGQVTPNMLDKLKFGTYIFFAAFCLIMFLWVLFFLPETRYKSMEEMDLVFGDNSGTVDRERMQEIMAEIGLVDASSNPGILNGDVKIGDESEHIEKKET
jgi:hypothetical protein